MNLWMCRRVWFRWNATAWFWTKLGPRFTFWCPGADRQDMTLFEDEVQRNVTAPKSWAESVCRYVLEPAVLVLRWLLNSLLPCSGQPARWLASQWTRLPQCGMVMHHAAQLLYAPTQFPAVTDSVVWEFVPTCQLMWYSRVISKWDTRSDTRQNLETIPGPVWQDFPETLVVINLTKVFPVFVKPCISVRWLTCTTRFGIN